jgi:hypothetical protein
MDRVGVGETVTEPLDNDRVEFLAKRFMGIVRSHYLEGPTGRDRVLEVLNALACTVAFVLAGDDDSAQEFFNEALENQIDEILARKEQSDK